MIVGVFDRTTIIFLALRLPHEQILLTYKLCIPSHPEEPKPAHGIISHLYSCLPTFTT